MKYLEIQKVPQNMDQNSKKLTLSINQELITTYYGEFKRSIYQGQFKPSQLRAKTTRAVIRTDIWGICEKEQIIIDYIKNNMLNSR
ncbi:unnamed protein product [Paramecium sonneborni]|uniref:Uncharacterized protein n=1 Tax=Paramecium sonneborni TaxID=65129 RepID=A0A8S1LZ48_9CILI|nr:unnamed protein product [Paramecium sonneborni]